MSTPTITPMRPQNAPSSPPAPPPRRRRRAPIAAVIVALVGSIALAGTFRTAGGPSDDGHAAAMSHREPLPADVAGTYRAGDDHLSLFGTLGMPSYERRGEHVMLRGVDDDRFVAWDDPDHSLEVERTADGVVSGVTVRRPGTAAWTGTPVAVHVDRDVRFSHGDVTLAGTIVAPTGEGPHPAVVLVHGAEMATREQYRHTASQLARLGVAALIYDKRGVGESQGDYRGATFDELTGDALAGLRTLRDDPRVDPAMVGMAGFSQGGWIIAMAADRSDDVAFVVPVSASGFSPAAQARWLDGNQLVQRGLGEPTIDLSEKAWNMMMSSRELVEAGVMPAMPGVMGFWFHALDPDLDAGALWERVHQPVLGIWGELDCQVPAHDSLQVLRSSLERAGNDRYSLHVLAGADHGMSLLEPCAQETTGWSVTTTHLAEGYPDLIAEWISELHAGATPPRREVVLPSEPTPSALGWHQRPTRTVAWFGSFGPQMAAIALLLATLTAIGLPWLWRHAVDTLRRRERRRDPAGAAAFAGSAALLLGLTALFEVLLLSDAHAVPLLGGARPFGVTLTFAIASLAAVVAVGLGVRHGLDVFRARRTVGGPAVPARAWVVAIAAALLAAWTAYWGFIPVGMLV